MDVKAPQGMLCLFDQVEDPRMERSKLHRLSDILVITLCAVIFRLASDLSGAFLRHSVARHLRAGLRVENG